MAIRERIGKGGKKRYQVLVGKENRVVGTYSRKGDAEKIETECKARAQRGQFNELFTAPRSIAVAELVEEWLNATRAQGGITSRDRWDTSRLVGLHGARNVASIQPRDCDAVVAACVADGLAVGSTNAHIKAMRRVFGFAVRRKYLKESPAVDRKLLPPDELVEDRVRVLTVDEHARLLAAIDPHYHCAVLIWPLIGLRISELFGLAWEHVDLKRGKLSVRQQVKMSRPNKLGTPKTPSSVRTIDIGPEVVKALREWKARCPHSASGLVFPGKVGGVVNPHDFRENYWAKARATANLPDVIPHDFRHTFASLLLHTGRSVSEVADMLGHKDANVTLNTYSHIVKELAERRRPLSFAEWRVITESEDENEQVTGSN